MSWQDVSFMAAHIVSAMALIPMLKNGQGKKIPLTTSLPTVIVVVPVIAAQVSYGNVLATCSTVVIAVVWGLLAWQRWQSEP